MNKQHILLFFILAICGVSCQLSAMHPDGRLTVPATNAEAAAQDLLIAEIEARRAQYDAVEAKREAEKFVWHDSEPEAAEEESSVKADKPAFSVKPIEDTGLACTGLPKDMQNLVREYLCNHREYLPAFLMTERRDKVPAGMLYITNKNIIVKISTKGSMIQVADLKTGVTHKFAVPYTPQILGCMAPGYVVCMDNVSGALDVWDPVRRSLVQRLMTQGQVQSTVHVKSDCVLFGQRDGIIQVWCPLTNSLQELKGHTGKIEVLDRMPENGHIISASQDKTVRIWDPATGECIKRLSWDYVCRNIKFLSPDKIVLSDASRGSVETFHLCVWDIKNNTSQEKEFGKEAGKNDACDMVTASQEIIIDRFDSIDILDASLHGVNSRPLSKRVNDLCAFDSYFVRYASDSSKGFPIYSICIYDPITGAVSAQLPYNSPVFKCDKDTLVARSEAEVLHIYQLEPQALEELRSMSTEQLAGLRELIDGLQKFVYAANPRGVLLDEPTIIVFERLEALFKQLPPHIRNCIAAFYQVAVRKVSA